MSYTSIMVGVDPGADTPGRVKLAAQVASRFDALLIGVAAQEPAYPRGYGETVMPAGYGIEEVRQAALDKLAGAEQIFRQVACLNNRIEWRSDIGDPVRYLEEQSRAADLVVLGRQGSEGRYDRAMSAGPGDALMGLGRPVLLVPPHVEQLSASRIVVAWKNTAQTRRAIADAMPLLKSAEAVQVLQVTDSSNRTEIEDVTLHLERHGVRATPVQRSKNGSGVAATIQANADAFGADLIVSGAFGYSRLREWFFGGVTRSFLDHSPVCCLMSH